MDKQRDLVQVISDETIFFDECDRVARAETTPAEAADRLANYIMEQLDKLGQPANVRNAALVSGLISAKLLPNAPLSQFTLRADARGNKSDFSNTSAKVYAPYRGVACVLVTLKSASDVERSRKKAARQIHEAIDEMGHRPNPEDIVE